MEKPIVIATHERSGTHLTLDTLRRQFKECNSWKFPGERLDRLYISLESILYRDGAYNTNTLNKILRRSSRPLIKCHQYRPDFTNPALKRFPSFKELLQESEILYVVRDGRAVMSSMLEFLKRTDNEKKMSQFMRGKREGVSLPKYWSNHVENWLETPGVKVLRVEELTRNPAQVLTRLSGQLGLTAILRKPLLPAHRYYGWMNAVARFFCVRPQSTAIIPGIMKRAVTPKWYEVFTPEDRRFFHEQAGETLLKLGYVQSKGWVNE